ncbi:exocyst complex component EXO70E2 [Rutidosis leptorrhynchoides]|uniref:exocyst complex component EXO70E2 n=1 Tax=Rutidosis leptorrhynchoides TaxID=125765 RepID=UPI003A99A6F3
MAEYQSNDGEQHVIAAARHIVKALGSTKNLSDDLRRILLDLDSHLSSLTIVTEDGGGGGGGGGGLFQIEQRLKDAEKKVMNGEKSRIVSLSEYLEAVNEVQVLRESLRGLSLKGNKKHNELFGRADRILHIAMSSLEGEVAHILVEHRQFLEPDCISFRSHGNEVVYDESFVSLDDHEEAISSSNNDSDVLIIHLVDPKIIPDLKSIANTMFASDYGLEFCQAFICFRREALDDYMVVLEMENDLSIEEIMKLEWEILNNEIRKWVRAMKIITRIYLASEKQFCNKILGYFGISVNPRVFVEITKPSILRVLNFGEAVAMGSLRPEKLIRLLDMYEVMAELLPNVNELFSEDVGFWFRNEYQKLLRSIGESAKATLWEFRNAIASDESSCPFPNGGIHHLTRYVMNYLKILTEYTDTLNLLLRDPDSKDDSNLVVAEPENVNPISWHLRSITFTLESNLEQKSRLYKDQPLQHIFMMNNIHYMVRKVMGIELRVLFGDEWIRKRAGKYQQQARNYERATWSFILSLLRNDGNSSRSVRERLRLFAAAFDEVYKLHTRWSIPDPGLRDDLRIANSMNLIPAFRSFLGQHSSHINDRHLKYSVTDLENLLLHFFEELPGSLHNSRRR